MSEHTVSTSRCKSCGNPVYWLRAENNLATRMPVNILPPKGVKGNVVIDLYAGTYRVLTAIQQAEYPHATYTSHFATCPAASKHRKRK